MRRDRPSATQVQAARREIVACCVLFVAAVVVAVLASRGTFNSMMMFPHIFAGIVSVVALLTLLRAKGVLMGVRVTLVAAVIIDHYDLRYPTLVEAPDSPGHRAYRVRSYPTTVLIDGDGVVIDYGAGLRGSARLMEEARALVAGVR